MCKVEKALYGSIQAARQWWKKIKEAMLILNFMPREADPCFFIKKDTKCEVNSDRISVGFGFSDFYL